MLSKCGEALVKVFEPRIVVEALTTVLSSRIAVMQVHIGYVHEIRVNPCSETATKPGLIDIPAQV
jgi:hypothetical protein